MAIVLVGWSFIIKFNFSLRAVGWHQFPLMLWYKIYLIAQVLKPAERQRLVENIAGHAINASDFLQKRVVKNFSQADPEYGRAIQEKLDQLKAQRKAKVSLEV